MCRAGDTGEDALDGSGASELHGRLQRGLRHDQAARPLPHFAARPHRMVRSHFRIYSIIYVNKISSFYSIRPILLRLIMDLHSTQN